MTLQREMFSRGKAIKIARSTWTDKTKEEPVVKQILDGLRAHRIPAYRVRERISRCWRCKGFIGQPSYEGIPDIIGWITTKGPRFGDHQTMITTPLFIECKRPKGGQHRDGQIAFLNRALCDGAIALIAKSWEDVARELVKHGVNVVL